MDRYSSQAASCSTSWTPSPSSACGSCVSWGPRSARGRTPRSCVHQFIALHALGQTVLSWTSLNPAAEGCLTNVAGPKSVVFSAVVHRIHRITQLHFGGRQVLCDMPTLKMRD